MTAPHDPGDPPDEYRSDSGSSPLSGNDDGSGYQDSNNYPSSPVQYPTPDSTGQFGPVAGQFGPVDGQPAPYVAGAYDPTGYSPPPYGQSPYAAPGYGSPYPFGTAPRNGMGTAALVLGILSVVLSWTVLGAIILGILAIIFGSIGLSRTNHGQATNRGAAVAGLVLGIVSLALLVLLVSVGLFAA